MTNTPEQVYKMLCFYAQMAESAYAADLKSADLWVVRVQVPL